MYRVGRALGVCTVRGRADVVLGLLDEEVVEEEAEVDAVLLEELLALEVRDLDRLVDGAGVDVGAVDLLPEHLRVHLDLLFCPFDETWATSVQR